MITPIAVDEKFDVLDKKGKYLISSYGRCYSLSRHKFLKQNINSNGYARYDIAYYENCKRIFRKQIFVHIAVVEHFGDYRGNTLDKAEKYINIINIDHRNRNRMDNCQKNLEITSALVNQRRKYVDIDEIDNVCDDCFDVEDIFK